MRTAIVFVFSIAVLAGGIGGTAAAGERPAQTKCPITGKALASAATPIAVTVDGFTFQVADAAGRDQALSDPAGAFAGLAKNNEAAEPVSQACPIMGNRINKNLFIQKDGRRVYICCKGCTKRVENNWEGTLRKLAEQAERGDPDDLPTM